MTREISDVMWISGRDCIGIVKVSTEYNELFNLLISCSDDGILTHKPDGVFSIILSILLFKCEYDDLGGVLTRMRTPDDNLLCKSINCISRSGSSMCG